jgi:hypothetical protein
VIQSDNAVYPNNVVEIIATRAALLDDEPDPNNRVVVLKRPLRNTDPIQSIGVFGTQWTFDPDSFEFRGTPQHGPSEPTLQRYTLGLQAFVKDMDEVRGLYTHSVLTKMIRSMLYHDDPLRVALSALSVSMDGSTESTKRWGISQTRYLSNEISGEWLYLSTMDFWLETEST